MIFGTQISILCKIVHSNKKFSVKSFWNANMHGFLVTIYFNIFQWKYVVKIVSLFGLFTLGDDDDDKVDSILSL